MDTKHSISIVTEYAARWGVTVPSPLNVVAIKSGFRCVEHQVLYESDDWMGIASVMAGQSTPAFVDFRPNFAALAMLPPWAAYSSYDSVTSGWRQGYGDGYLSHWINWLVELESNDRTNYLTRYPAPIDERLWGDWFESVVKPSLPIE